MAGGASALYFEDDVTTFVVSMGIAEDIDVEVTGTVHVRGPELGPYERTMLIYELGPDVFLRLPQAEQFIGGALYKGHPAGVGDISRTHQDRRARALGLGCH